VNYFSSFDSHTFSTGIDVCVAGRVDFLAKFENPFFYGPPIGRRGQNQGQGMCRRVEGRNEEAEARNICRNVFYTYLYN
jgi:hypothetical protein